METPRKDDYRDDREIPSQENDTTDEVLFRRYQQNHDAAAFRTIHDRYTAELETFLRRRLKALAANTDEVLQDVFADLAACEEPLEENALLRPFLFKIAKYRLIKHVQAAKAQKRDYRRTIHPDSQHRDDHHANGLSCIADPKASPEILDAKIEVNERMARLPSTEETAVRLVDLQGYSMPSAAKTLKLPSTNVEWRVRSGRERLKRMATTGVILLAIIGSTADGIELDRAMDLCTAETDEDEVCREDGGHHESTKLCRESRMRWLVRPEAEQRPTTSIVEADNEIVRRLVLDGDRPGICNLPAERQEAFSVLPPPDLGRSWPDCDGDHTIVPFGVAQAARNQSKVPGTRTLQAA